MILTTSIITLEITYSADAELNVFSAGAPMPVSSYLKNWLDIASYFNSTYYELLNSCRREIMEFQNATSQAQITYYVSANAIEDNTHYKTVFSAVSALPKLIANNSYITVATGSYEKAVVNGFYGNGKIYIQPMVAVTAKAISLYGLEIINNNCEVQLINVFGQSWKFDNNRYVYVQGYNNTAVTGLEFYKSNAYVYDCDIIQSISAAVMGDWFSNIYVYSCSGTSNDYSYEARMGSLITRLNASDELTGTNSSIVYTGGTVTSV